MMLIVDQFIYIYMNNASINPDLWVLDAAKAGWKFIALPIRYTNAQFTEPTIYSVFSSLNNIWSNTYRVYPWGILYLFRNRISSNCAYKYYNIVVNTWSCNIISQFRYTRYRMLQLEINIMIGSIGAGGNIIWYYLSYVYLSIYLM